MRQTSYIWQRSEWPTFRWDADRLLAPLGAARLAQGEFRSTIGHLGFPNRQRAELEARTDEAFESADIEGEPVSRIAIRSSVARRLDIRPTVAAVPDAREEGLVDMTTDATAHYAEPLTAARLHRWHAGLFPTPIGGRPHLAVGRWRDDASGPMQVVSGRIDAPTVHFEAPPAARVAREIQTFLDWFDATSNQDGLIRSALAQLWFVTIHPYDDGNGRIARAISEMALARDETSSHRYFSLSRQINREKRAYYEALEQTQRADLDVTAWLAWFLGCYARAIRAALATTGDALRANTFWQQHERVAFTDRQRRMLARYLDGFEGNLTAKKWSALAKVSLDTAQRDIADLVANGVVVRNAGGSKNTSYSVVGFDS